MFFMKFDKTFLCKNILACSARYCILTIKPFFSFRFFSGSRKCLD